MLTALAFGCAAERGPEVLTIPAGQYQAYFARAEEATREIGLAPALKDIRGGVLETEARIAGSILEPWKNDNATASQALENTLHLQRLRARFEFAPAGLREKNEILTAEGLPGPSPPGLEPTTVDLSNYSGELELRAWVFVERAHVPGVRRSTWSRYATTTTELITPEQSQGLPGGTFWTPVERDVAFERRLLAAIERDPG